MSQVTLGSYNGTVAAGVEMIDELKRQELASHEYSILRFAPMVLRKIGIIATPGVMVKINGCRIPIPVTGVFELGMDQINVVSLIFESDDTVCIHYGY